MTSAPKPTIQAHPPLLWDIFCRVIDNHGDLGVCWRLSADLAQRGHRVRLWVDDASALRWMAPLGVQGVQVFDWNDCLALDTVGDVVVEGFGCELPQTVQARIAERPRTVWLNLEYLSAEEFVERSHGLPSPVMRGAAQGLTKHFFYPGFTSKTGGLLREADVLTRQNAFDPNAWRRSQGLPDDQDALWVSLFCYEPAGLLALLHSLATASRPVRVLATAGRAQQALTHAVQQLGWQDALPDQLHIHPLPYLSQTDYDHLLWSCQLNCVRGEDSLVRALWAGQALVWHIYPQEDKAHHAKLDSFLDWLQAPTSLRDFHHAWNGMSTPKALAVDLKTWQACIQAARERLLAQQSLVEQLLEFVSGQHNAK